MARIVIGVPSGGYWKADFGACLFGMINDTLIGHELLLSAAQSSFITINRNKIVRKALEFEADYLLFLDTDMVFPPDTLARLLAWDKDIVGATYRRRISPHTLLGFIKDPELQLKDEVPALWEMLGLPGGCILIKMDVYRNLTKPWYRESYEDENDEQGTEDYYFSDLARKGGYKLWCDSTLTADLGHIGDQMITEKRDENNQWVMPGWTFKMDEAPV